MNDLELTEEHDLLLQDGDLNLLNNEARVAKQALKINLLWFQGEWFLDSSYGIPYFQDILGKVRNKSLPDNIIQEATRNSYNIERLISFNSRITPDRQYVVDTLEAETLDGEIISIQNIQI